MFLELALAAAQMAGCHPIRAEHIYGRDLAAAVPALSSLPPAEEISFSPIPGQRRVFRSNELTRIAKARGIAVRIDDEVCFEWPRSLPKREDVLAAMSASLKELHGDVELVDAPTNPIPEGVLNFPLSGLSGSSQAPVVWRGTVTYAPGRTLAIWARVRVTVHERHVIAANTLRPGQRIAPLDLRTENYIGPFQRETKYSDPQQVIGLMPKNTVSPGTALSEVLLRPANDVERGDTVQVIVQVAQTRIEAQGIAEDDGIRGSFVTVRNPKTGRKFRARVQDKDQVLVLPTGLAGLVTEDSKS